MAANYVTPLPALIAHQPVDNIIAAIISHLSSAVFTMTQPTATKRPLTGWLAKPQQCAIIESSPQEAMDRESLKLEGRLQDQWKAMYC